MERYQLAAEFGPFLATRERGRRVREEVEQRLSSISTGETLILDFAGVDGITVSFGDESIAKLVLARETGDFADRGMVLDGANEDVRETLEAVLARRKVALASLDKEGEPMIIGEQGWLPATLEAALAMHEFSAADLAERLSITPQAANNRLRLLVASGAVARQRVVPEGGGKEFSYKAAVPSYV
jgi:hypothetical protein